MAKTVLPEKTVFLIDGSSFLYRAYYGLRPMHTKSGMTIQAVYGFCRMIHKLIKTFNPKYIALVWDSPGQTERKDMYPDYKATRQAPPSDLFEQKELIQEFADLIGLKQVQMTGIEADDLMYSLAQDFHMHTFTTILVTSDKDLGQVVEEDILLFDPFKDDFVAKEQLEEKYGFPLEKLPFYFAIIGDSSDNIPGVRGIGPKGAQDLVKQFDSLEDLYNNIDKVTKERTQQLLLASKENAFLSLELFKLRYHELETSIDDFQFDAQNWSAARTLFEKLDFKSLLKELPPTEYVVPSLGKKYNFVTVQTPEQLQEVVNLIQTKKAVALDTETTGLDPWSSTLVGISLCVEHGTSYYIPVGHLHDHQLLREQVVAALKPVLEDPTIKKYLHHSNFDLLVLHNAGIDVQGEIFDTMIAASLVTEEWQRIGLKYLSSFYLHEEMPSFGDIVKRNGYQNFAQVPLNLATDYAAGDAHQTATLVPIMEKKLREDEQYDLFKNIETPLVPILFAMEKEGIIVDKEILKKIDTTVTQELDEVRGTIIAMIGDKYKDINLNSPKQLQELLFIDLKLPPAKKTGQKTGYSTDQEVLAVLAKIHVVPGLIMRYRELAKLKNTYLEPLVDYINSKTGRIHTTFSQTGTATGRLASQDPNLQNIPVDTTLPVHIRSAFKAPPGHYFVSADYSQIELRVLAYVSQDATLIKAFLAGEDIHARTAAGLFEVPIDKVTNEQRQVAKRINFSILYGLTPYGLSKDLDIPYNDAKKYIERYLAQYPGVTTWMEKVILDAKNNGYVTTLWGRRRYVPGIYEKNKVLYENARRIAINTVAQGTAAEIMKLGMIALDKVFKEHNLDAKMVLQIHDELLISAPIDHIEQTKQLTVNTLQNVVQWNIPLIVTARSGNDWFEVTK